MAILQIIAILDNTSNHMHCNMYFAPSIIKVTSVGAQLNTNNFLAGIYLKYEKKTMSKLPRWSPKDVIIVANSQR